MAKEEPGISDAAVTEATGRSWKEWERLLDHLGGEGLSHKELVALVRDQGEVARGWWQQSVAVGYARLRGKRAAGQTAKTGFQIGVQRTVTAPHARVWEWLTSREGIEAWLGASGELVLEPGERYRLDDGSKGEVRVAREGDRLRITWKPPEWDRPSTIQVPAEPKGNDRTVVGFHEEHLPSQEVREARRGHFKEAANRLVAAVTSRA